MTTTSAASDQARVAAVRVKKHPLLTIVARGGFIAYGVLHLLVAWLALRIAFGKPAPEGDQSGALRTLVEQPFGRVLVIVAIVGLAAMALWQVLEALVGHREETGYTRTGERLLSAGRAVVYGYFAVTAAKVVKGADKSSADSQESAARGLLGASVGRFAVVVIGLAVAAIGIGLIWYGVTKHFDKHLLSREMSAGTRRVVCRIGTVGYVAKGVAYGIAGLLLVMAAVNYDVEKARGLDAALRNVAAQPYGTFLLALIALGLAAYGVFGILQSRYRKV